MGEVVNDIGVAFVELAGRGIVAVALLGDGERDDADRWIRHGFNELSALSVGVEHIEHRADDAALRAGCVANGQRVQEILRGQGIAGIRAAERGADDAPARIFLQ